MKKNLFILLLAMFTIVSCKTKEKIIYLQDVENNAEITTQSANALKLVPGDKIGIIVTSAATPDLAAR